MKDIKAMEEKTDEVCDKCGSPMVIKWGRYGKFLACSNYPECKNTRQLAGGAGAGEGAPELHDDVAQQTCPVHNLPMVLKCAALQKTARSADEMAGWQTDAGLTPRRPIYLRTTPGAAEVIARKPRLP